MKQVYIKTRKKWRDWFGENHSKEEKGIWLLFYKKNTNKPSLGYEETVEEALCFGWIACAKRPETQKRRIIESIALLEQNKKLGLK